MILCAKCRAAIGRATRQGVRAARANGTHVGRPVTPITNRDLDRVRAGTLTAAELARKVGCSAVTVRRRLAK